MTRWSVLEVPLNACNVMSPPLLEVGAWGQVEYAVLVILIFSKGCLLLYYTIFSLCGFDTPTFWPLAGFNGPSIYWLHEHLLLIVVLVFCGPNIFAILSFTKLQISLVWLITQRHLLYTQKVRSTC